MNRTAARSIRVGAPSFHRIRATGLHDRCGTVPGDLRAEFAMMDAEALRAVQAPLKEQCRGRRFELKTGAAAEDIVTLPRLTERYCVVYRTLARGAGLEVTRERV
jgi:hypothetical protein